MVEYLGVNQANIHRKMINSLHSRGIILTPLLIFIALVSMIAGTVAVLNRGVFAWDSGESRGQLNAATLKKQAADLKAGFSQAVASGIEGGLITLDEGSKGLYNPSAGFAIKPTIPASACAVASCEWQINTTLKISDIVGSSSSSSGSSSGSSTPTTEGCVQNNGVFTYFVLAQTKEPKDIVFLAPGLNASACEQIMKEETPTFAIDGSGTAIPATLLTFVPGSTSSSGSGSTSGSGGESSTSSSSTSSSTSSTSTSSGSGSGGDSSTSSSSTSGSTSGGAIAIFTEFPATPIIMYIGANGDLSTDFTTSCRMVAAQVGGYYNWGEPNNCYLNYPWGSGTVTIGTRLKDTCPENSTWNGPSCVCASGYRADISAKSCVPFGL